MTTYNTREEWLKAAVELMKPHFARAGFTIPPVRVSCGWPSTGGLGTSKVTMGECWAAEASSDKIPQIFITPRTDKPEDAYGVLPVLVHEVVHAVVGHEAKHGPDFKACAVPVGLVGKMTSTTAGDDLMATFKKWLLELGDYPHVALDPKMRPKKKQTTRMIKCTCRDGNCGYTLRISRSWIDDVGMPHCPKHGKMESDYIPPTEAGNDDDANGGEE